MRRSHFSYSLSTNLAAMRSRLAPRDSPWKMLEISDTERSSTSLSMDPSPFFFSLTFPMKMLNSSLSPSRPPLSSVKPTNWSTAGANLVIAKSSALRAAARAALFFLFKTSSISWMPSASTKSCLFSSCSRQEVSTSNTFSINSSSSWLAGSRERYGATDVSSVSMPPAAPSIFWFFSDACIRMPSSSLTDCFTVPNSFGFRRDSIHFRILVFSITASATGGLTSTRFSTMLSALNTAAASSSTLSSNATSRCTSSSIALFSSSASTSASASSSLSSIASPSVSSRMRSMASAAMSTFSCLSSSSSVGMWPRLTSSG
mmetsp:Transcript_19225/g.49344  ORF Transcript_19225/g.49344 Transcript_19225/m.49344 type:complete len:317 (-) Transcript_19225:198-1148(-)